MDVLLSCDEGRECVMHIRELMMMTMRALCNLKPNDMRKKESLQETLRNINKEFQYLRIFYNICEANASEFVELESLVPLKEPSVEEYAGACKKRDTLEESLITKEPPVKEYAEACRERDALKEEVVLRNQELEEIIKHMRTTIYGINCELALADVSDKEKTDIEQA